MFDSIAVICYTVNNYAAATDRGSDAVVGLVVERAANVAARVLPITGVSEVVNRSEAICFKDISVCSGFDLAWYTCYQWLACEMSLRCRFAELKIAATC